VYSIQILFYLIGSNVGIHCPFNCFGDKTENKKEDVPVQVRLPYKSYSANISRNRKILTLETGA
jgi:hypothetical protein